MAGKKDNAIVAVISGLTSNQASLISRGIMQLKDKHAPFSRGTIASGKHSVVGALLQKGTKRIGGN